MPSFGSVSGYFAKDKDHVYHEDDVLKDADAASFVHLEARILKIKSYLLQ
ncbi:hypothetical protein EJ377_04945 [Chryseobacterium arthrosphaerae]|uniref:Uncharacterized protein n=1 Tax=Chryseobacterium arthrosphaerae TaxID=651561 RepID=A0A432E225_9FLAO|nr:hypothetical protein EJ377_04945 [Chryseobacterium arthrosphaerae]